MFIDEAEIEVRAGAGGNGSIAFRREKFVPRGGPSGGDGGRGGSVFLVANGSLNTLYPFRFQRRFAAERGEHGMGSNCHGRDGADVRVAVPVGSVVTDLETGSVVHDFLVDGEELLVAKGGNGGFGNARFATSTRQAPRFAKEGLPGQERRLRIELKLLADVGLVGFPNAGKSTLISVVSKARPKIADYPFTTLVPNLGVATLDGLETIVVADIPGLIEGASEGHGLGSRFLKHVDRCALLCHLVDLSMPSETDDVEHDLSVLERELEAWNPGLAARPRVLVGSKLDSAIDERTEGIRAAAQKRGLRLFLLSAATNAGVRELLEFLVPEVRRLRDEAAREERDRIELPPALPQE
jgi:GTPase